MSENIALPENAWDIIEKHLPNYSSSDLVLECDLLEKYCENEEMSKKDKTYIEDNYMDQKHASIALKKLTLSLYLEAIFRMPKSFAQDELNTTVQHEVHSRIMEKASDTAEAMTELDCKLNNIQCWVEEDNESRFTEEAQDIFEIHYDREIEELYTLLNNQLKAIN